jgi:hypothetical protein
MSLERPTSIMVMGAEAIAEAASRTNSQEHVEIAYIFAWASEAQFRFCRAKLPNHTLVMPKHSLQPLSAGATPLLLPPAQQA